MASKKSGDVQGPFRLVVDTPSLRWRGPLRPDGSAEFFNQRWLDYTGPILREQALGLGMASCDFIQTTCHEFSKTFREALNSCKAVRSGGPLSAASTASFAGFSLSR